MPVSLRRLRLALPLLLSLFAPGHARAGDLLVTIRSIEGTEGSIRVAACPPEGYPEGSCRFVARAPARPGSLELRIAGLPEGRFGLSAFHDADGDGRIGKDWLGRPTEAVGFGNDAPIGRFGPPGFEAASIAVPAEGVLRTAMTLRYR